MTDFYIPRSLWTSTPPKSKKGADEVEGLGNYREPVGISIHSYPDSLTYLNNNAVDLLEMLRHENYSKGGLGDISYNFAVPSNREGFYCLRGIISKSSANATIIGNNDYVSVFCLSGVTEAPTDQLLFNLNAAVNYIQSRYPSAEKIVPFSEIKPGGTHIPGETLSSLLQKDIWEPVKVTHSYLAPAPLPVGITNVHVFDLIEALAFHGYYQSRNDGYYGPLVELAVRNLQQDLLEADIYPKQVTGVWDKWTRDCWSVLISRE